MTRKDKKFDAFKKPVSGIAVDASVTGGIPGWGEYKGIDIETGEVLFHHVIGMTTNNVAEFIALCHGMIFALVNGYDMVFSDSQTARYWVIGKKCGTKCTYNAKTKRGMIWAQKSVQKIKDLKISGYQETFYVNGMVNVRKWDTINWGENPADFGRK
jgi:ribonuclease HI